MKITKIICDFCQDKEAEAKSISIFSHRETDAAGSTDSVYEFFDMCSVCLVNRLDLLISTLNEDQKSSLLYDLKLKRKNNDSNNSK